MVVSILDHSPSGAIGIFRFCVFRGFRGGKRYLEGVVVVI